MNRSFLITSPDRERGRRVSSQRVSDRQYLEREFPLTRFPNFARRDEFVNLDRELLANLVRILLDVVSSSEGCRNARAWKQGALTLLMFLASAPDCITKGVAMIAANAVEYEIDSGLLAVVTPKKETSS